MGPRAETRGRGRGHGRACGCGAAAPYGRLDRARRAVARGAGGESVDARSGEHALVGLIVDRARGAEPAPGRAARPAPWRAGRRGCVGLDAVPDARGDRRPDPGADRQGSSACPGCACRISPPRRSARVKLSSRRPLRVSTRRVERLAAELGVTQLSRSQVSAMATHLDEQARALRERPLDAGPYPVVWVDALTRNQR